MRGTDEKRKTKKKKLGKEGDPDNSVLLATQPLCDKPSFQLTSRPPLPLKGIATTLCLVFCTAAVCQSRIEECSIEIWSESDSESALEVSIAMKSEEGG